MEKPWPREVKCLALSHLASKFKNLASNPGQLKSTTYTSRILVADLTSSTAILLTLYRAIILKHGLSPGHNRLLIAPSCHCPKRELRVLSHDRLKD